MKLGIFLLTENYASSPHATLFNDIELAVYAEKLGFDEVWFAEHHFNSFSVIPNPSLMMAYLAAKTTKIRIGSAAFLAPFYHPTRLAEEIATLDNLSFGRINAGFAKGGFALDMEFFEKSSENLREEMFKNIKTVEQNLSSESSLQPKPLQKKIPFFVATFSTNETIEFAAQNGYGLMFSQGATIEDCEAACGQYKTIAGYEPEVILMRVFAVADTEMSAQKIALPATDHFVKCMKSLNAHAVQPRFNKENYDELLAQRYDFFDAKKFMDAAIIGTPEMCIEQIKMMKGRIQKLHLVLKVASVDAQMSRKMLKIFNEKIQPKI
jgi:alkanesulfonate monooxygenase SsuD/methylene tetrahydromethanopterin reductase-like flavin-dependent oxidoreductase (luciferase family)